MNCYYSGILGLALISGSVSTLSVTEEQHDYLREVLSDDLDKIYDKIIIERRNQYIVGLVIGILISIFITRYVTNLDYFTQVMLFFTITLGSALIFYMLMPKSDYMLNHLKTEEENKRWLEVYKYMKMRYFVGFSLGILAAIPLANAFCK